MSLSLSQLPEPTAQDIVEYAARMAADLEKEIVPQSSFEVGHLDYRRGVASGRYTVGDGNNPTHRDWDKFVAQCPFPAGSEERRGWFFLATINTEMQGVLV